MIFVDTSFWIALRLRRERHHSDAARLLQRFGDEPLVTTNHVRGETWTFLNRRVGHAAAVSFLNSLDRSPRLRVVLVTEELEADALRWLRRRDERPYSFVDATSFLLMKSLRIRNVLAFDEDFAAAGFTQLRAS